MYSGYEIACIVLSTGVVVLSIGAVVLGAVALGGYIVYKTKREDGTAFQMHDSAGDVGVAPGEYDDIDVPLGEDTSDRKMDEALDGVLKHTQRFMRQQDTVVRR